MKKIVPITGLAVMLVTVILYFTILGNSLLTVIHFVTLAAILLAEAATTFYAWVSKGNPRKVGAAVLSGLMIPYSVILSVVYIVNFPQGYLTYIGWYCAAGIVVNALALVLVQFNRQKVNEDSQLQSAKNNILGLRKLVNCILADPAAKPYETQLRSLEEQLHFSKDNVICAEDAQIRSYLLELQNSIANPEYDTAGMLEKLKKTIEIRNIMA